MVDAPEAPQRAGQGLLARLEPLLAAISRRQQHQVWRLVADGHLGDGHVATSMRRILAEKLNGPKHELAKRLFSDSWQPLLVGDPHLLQADASLPGMLHELDVGALWFALQHFGMKETAERVQGWLEQECDMTPIDELILAKPVQSMRQMVREEAAALLSALMAGERGQREEFLRFMNTWRAQELTEQLGVFDVPGMEALDLHQLSWMVTHAQGVVDLLPRGALAIDKMSDIAAAEHLLDVAYKLSGGAEPDRKALWPLLVVMHRTFRYGIGAEIMRKLPKAACAAFGEALIGHAMTWARSINSAMTNVLGEVHPTGFKAITFLPATRQALGVQADRLAMLLPLLQNSALAGSQTRDRLMTLLGNTSQSVVPALVEGIYVRLERYLNKSEELIDFPDLIWFGTFHVRLLKTIAPNSNAMAQPGSRQRRIVSQCQDLYRRGGSTMHASDPGVLFERYARLFAMAKAYGGRPQDWLQPPDRRVAALCLQMLDNIDTLAEPLRALPLSMVAAAQEYSKTKPLDGILALLCRKGESARQKLRAVIEAGGV